jgi:copper(I)-binding protein
MESAMPPEFRRRAVVLLGSVLTLGLAVLGPLLQPARGGEAAPAAQVRDAWIRWLPGNLPAGGYLRLTNSGDVPLILLGASSPEFGQVSLHRSVNRGGVMDMEPVEQLRIAPHASLEFGSSGYHLMLMQPRSALKPGDQVPILLSFAGGQSVSVRFTVRGADAQ